jgi:hypothetical protein
VIEEVRVLGKKLFRLMLTLGVALGTLLSGTGVVAASGNVTKGDVEAALQSWDTGFRAAFLIGGTLAAGPVEAFLRARIPPLPGGRHYCVDDWHLVQVAWVTGGDASFTRQDALLDLSGITNTFLLDGHTLPLQQTPVVRRVVPTFGDIDYGFSVGSILSPSDLAVGEHTLVWQVTFPDDAFQTEDTFYIDASGTGACVQ